MGLTTAKKQEKELTVDQLQIKPGDRVQIDSTVCLYGTVRKIIGGVAWVIVDDFSNSPKQKEVYSLHKLHAVA